MRPVLLLTLLALGACTRMDNTASNAADCSRSATHEVTWSGEAPDVITARAEGPSCAQAVVTWVARNANGDPLWAFASTYYDMSMGGMPSEGAPPVSSEQMDRFLSDWANVSLMRTTELPEWRGGVATLTEGATTFAYDTPFDRETYEMLRTRDLPMLCFASAVEAADCLIVDPLSRAPTRIVSYGP
jgi:hypothetical protein